MSKVFTTSAGVQIGVQAVPPLLVEKVRAAAAASVEVPPVPTYLVELGDGTQVPAEHDESTLETDEDKAVWHKYQTALRLRDEASGTKTMNLYFVKGTTIEPPNDDWIAEQEYFGVAVPADPAGRKLHYIQTELLNTTDDIQGLMVAIMEASGIDQEVVSAANASFRRALRQETDTASGTDGTPPVAQAGPVVHESTL